MLPQSPTRSRLAYAASRLCWARVGPESGGFLSQIGQGEAGEKRRRGGGEEKERRGEEKARRGEEKGQEEEVGHAKWIHQGRTRARAGTVRERAGTDEGSTKTEHNRPARLPRASRRSRASRGPGKTRRILLHLRWWFCGGCTPRSSGIIGDRSRCSFPLQTSVKY